MARKQTPKSDGDTGDLLSSKAQEKPKASASPPSPTPTPKLLEYTPLASSDKWHVEKFEEFAVEFGLIGGQQSFETQMVHFHELGIQNKRPWLICRRLYGIGPMIPSDDAQPDDLRPLSRQEICNNLGITLQQLKAELDSLRALLQAQHTNQERLGGKHFEEQTPVRQKETLTFDDDILREFGFEDTMFNVVTYNPMTKTEERRPVEANRVEKNWFCKRVQEWSKMLGEPVGGALAREALLNELYLRRFGQEMSMLGPSSKKWEDLYKSKRQIEETYQEQVNELQGMFPELAIANKTSFRAVISDLVKAHQEYYGRKNRQLIDKLFTSTEIEVLLRQSAQAPEPRYRFGMNMAIIEAMHYLHDPDYRPQFKMSILKKLDAGFKEGVVRMRETMNEPLVDLENGVSPGEGDDFEDLLGPPEEPGTEQTPKPKEGI